MFDQMLIEYRHNDRTTRGPDEDAVFYFVLKFDWAKLIPDPEALVTEEVITFMGDRCLTLLETSPRSFVRYWKNGRMEEEVGLCRQEVLKRCARHNAKKRR